MDAARLIGRDAEAPSTARPPASSPRRARAAALLAPSLLALLLHAPALGGALVHDGRSLVESAPRLDENGGLQRALLDAWWGGEGVSTGLWRPLSTLTLSIQRTLGADAPAAIHGVDVVLHAAVTALVTALVLSLSGSTATAAAGGLLFAAHPVHVEAVANAAGRPDLLAALLVLAALLLHRLAVLSGDGARRQRRARVAAVTAFALALCAKENAVTFLALPLLHDLLLVPRASLRDALRRAAPFALVAGAWLAARGVVAGGLGVTAIPWQDNPLAHLPATERALAAVALVPRTVGLLLWPAELSHDYSARAVDPAQLGASSTAIGLLLLAAAVGMAVLTRRRAPAVAFLVAFGLATWSITSNLLVPIGAPLAERFLYLPSVAAAGLLALGLLRAGSRLAPGRAAAVPLVGAALLAVPLAGRTLERVGDWRSERSLYLHDAVVVPESARVRYNAGLVLLDEGRPREALRHLEASVDLVPGAAALFALGKTRGRLGDARGRERAYRRLGALHPGTYWAELAQGFLAGESGRFAQARDHFARALEERPDDPVARYDLGLALLATGEPGEAAAHLERAQGLPPALDVSRALALGRALERLGRRDEAVSVYRQALEDHPSAARRLTPRLEAARGAATQEAP